MRTSSHVWMAILMLIPLSLAAGRASAGYVPAGCAADSEAAATGTRYAGMLGAPISLADVSSGMLLFRTDAGAELRPAPAVDSQVEIRVSGAVARTALTQRFRNLTPDWQEGVYVFPLPERAAVDAMRLRIGERVIEGEIEERARARRTYERARREGRKASLLEQQRPNIFTMSVANIPPGDEVVVELGYQQLLRFDHGTFSLRFPMVVAPRYVPGRPVGDVARGAPGTGWARDTDLVPDASRVTPPVVPPPGREAGESPGLRRGRAADVRVIGTAEPARGTGPASPEGPASPPSPPNPLQLHVELDGGAPLGPVVCRSHHVRVKMHTPARCSIDLERGAVAADRDFVLEWRPASAATPAAGLLAEEVDGRQYLLLMLVPPGGTPAARAARLPRETVFVIDTSGSMHGASIEQARAALLLALGRLQPQDRFNVIQFNSRTDQLFAASAGATPENLRRAERWVRALHADGGTEMAPALEAALAGHGDEGGSGAGGEGGTSKSGEGAGTPSCLRQVIFMTDGAVADEARLFGIISRSLGRSRLFTVGIGSAPNSFFMRRAAEFGRGTFTYIGGVSEVEERMGALFAKLETPVLADIEVHWPTAGVESWPGRVPDLYLDEVIMIAARLPEGASLEGAVELRGARNGRSWRATVQLANAEPAAGAGKLWARRKIAGLMDLSYRGLISADEVREAVVELGLQHHLVTRYTSLVAVDRTPELSRRAADQRLRTSAVPVQLAAGMDHAHIFGSLPQGATPAGLLMVAGVVLMVIGLVLLVAGTPIVVAGRAAAAVLRLHRPRRSW